MASTPSAYPETRLLAALLLVIGCFYLFTFRNGHTWGDDFAMYLLHTRNVAEGAPYAATGYLYNPAEPHLGPPVYPPLFPLMIAPVYKVFGLNLTAYKAFEVLCFLLYLGVVYAITEKYLSPPWRLGLVALLGFNPYFWDFKDAILSDLPGLLLAACVVWIAQDSYRYKRFSIPRAILLGVAIYAAYAVRGPAIVLLPAVFLYELIGMRKLTRFSIVAGATAVAAILIQQSMIDSVGEIPSLFRLEPGWFVANTINYVKSLRIFWLNGVSNLLSFAIFGVAGLLTVWGVWKKGREAAGFLDIYLMLHLALIVAYSVPGAYRYLLPVLPLYLAYMLAGLSDVTASLPGLPGKALVAACAAGAVLTFGGLYKSANWKEIREGIGDPDFVAMAGYIHDNTPADARIVFLKPRVLALLSGHNAATYPNHASPEVLGAFLNDFNVQYVIATHLEHTDFAPDTETLWPYLQQPGAPVEKAYAVGPYSLYRVGSAH